MDSQLIMGTISKPGSENLKKIAKIILHCRLLKINPISMEYLLKCKVHTSLYNRKFLFLLPNVWVKIDVFF